METSEECRDALESHNVELPFIQIFNSWRSDSASRALASSPRLASLASQLLGAPCLRLYQVCFVKSTWATLLSFPIEYLYTTGFDVSQTTW
jgi:hypothetical protein